MVFRRSTSRQDDRARFRLKGRIVIVSLLVISSLLVFLSTTENDRFSPLRNRVESVTTPVLSVVTTPFRIVGQWGNNIRNLRSAQKENISLKTQLDELKHKSLRESLRADRLAHLEKILKVNNPLDIPEKRIAARIISEVRGPFAHSVLINIGAEENVKAGFPLMNGNGMIGHVIRVGERSSRVLLLKDLNSRVSVISSDGEARGILLGQNDGAPEIKFFDDLSDWEVGQEIFTSGDGGVLPQGLPIGTISKVTAKRLYVSLYADENRDEWGWILPFEPIEIPEDNPVSDSEAEVETETKDTTEATETPSDGAASE